MIGHAIDNLKNIEDGTIDLVVTSPPYWGLRDYKTEPVVFGGVSTCNHVWDDDDKTGWDENVPQTMGDKDVYPVSNETRATHEHCKVCHAWRGQLGLEASPELFVEHLVEIFEECRRILKPTGNLWVNLGDSYMRKSAYTAPQDYGLQKHRDEASQFRPTEIPDGYKRKDLVGLPWLFAFAARRAGWYLRNDIVWAKSISGPHYRGGVCMPEPVRDRCTRSHEFFFHFAKNSKYYYDTISSAEPLAEVDDGTTRNMRTVWHFNPQPFDGAHFAVYPKHLIEPIVKSSTSDHGCCGDCLVPWVREVIHYSDDITTGWRPNCECHGVLEKQEVITPGRAYEGDWKRDAEARDGVVERGAGGNTGLKAWGADANGEYNGKATKDFKAHGAEDASEVKARIIDNMTKEKKKNIIVYVSDLPLDEHPVTPAVVLDPFSGSGTSGIVAAEHGRSYIGIELNPEYAALSETRIKQERVSITTKKHRESAVELKEYW